MFKRIRNSTLGSVLSIVIFANLSVGTALQLGAVVSLPVITGAATCSKDQLVASAQDVVDVVTDPVVIAAVAKVSAEAKAKLEAITPIARNLVTAIKAGDISTALGLVNTIFPIVNEIADALHANEQVMGMLALANIALHFIINHAAANVATKQGKQGAGVAARTAIDYGAQRAWGCDYHKSDKRCERK